ncbi:hypothetical protein OB236_37105 [Paenibacillus sp. WQ 127069]|uniref:N-acetyltransferase n=1 Tax=Paenibacillus baimaensis TaxID=2982185 RepID=A0ABT2UUR0_9BACL|nr:hypothetical protein [Paenibacillus sp. WQ 127069]MCU6797756.1 hypothetical protein [Paenibacillus sp. WQ 127069]
MSMSYVNLRAFESEDMKELHRWFNDADSISMIGRVPRTYEETVQHVEKNAKTVIWFWQLKMKNYIRLDGFFCKILNMSTAGQVSVS